MGELLVEVTRGPLVDSTHSGHIAVVNSAGKLLYYAGDPYRPIFMRSGEKPILALNVILTGAAERYGFTDEELSIMCSSHYGEEFHRRVIQGMLGKMGLSMDDLLCGIMMSFSHDYMLKMVAQGHVWDQINSFCSGKHCGFLASCLTQGFPIETYDKMENPLQQQLLKLVSKMCEVDMDKIPIGEDGCGVPVHAMPLYNMALAYAKISNPERLEPEYQDACRRVSTAMNNAPEMLAGTGGFCTELVKCTNGKLIGKLGAEASYSIGVIGRDLGICVKIDDGNHLRPLNPTVIEVLKQLDILTEQELASLSQFTSPLDNKNTHHRVVGEIRTVFQLKKTLEPDVK